jgi:methylenetetrahydrofolate reductase (NADPH)
MTSQLASKLASGQFVITAEITPPLSTKPEDLIAKADLIKGHVDACNVTDGASARAHLDALVSAYLLQQHGVEPILQITCRDSNRIALQSKMIGAAALGITNILMLTGDDPKQGDQPEAKPVFDYDSSGLIAVAAMIRDQHKIPSGREIAGEAPFLLGVADAPVDPKEGWTPKSLQKKIESGAQFAQTQFCMDTGVVRRYMARLRESGVPTSFKFLIGIAPLASAKSATWMRENLFGTVIPDWIVERMEKAAEPRAEGRAIAVDLMRELKEIDGVAGVHIMAPLNEKSIAPVVSTFRG